MCVWGLGVGFGMNEVKGEKKRKEDTGLVLCCVMEKLREELPAMGWQRGPRDFKPPINSEKFPGWEFGGL